MPELFPFSKYLRQAQDNQITHMIDVQITTWALLLGLAWALEGTSWLWLSIGGTSEPRAIVASYVVFSWALLVLHIAVSLYFRHCLKLMLRAGGLTSDRDTISCLRAIADEEATVLGSELAGEALEKMQEIQERQEALRRKRQRYHVVEKDKGLQIIAMCCRRLGRLCRPSAPEDPLPAHRSSTSQVRARRGLAPLPIPWFSCKVYHFVVMFLLMVNGFYLALLLQCVAYQMTDLVHDFGFLTVLCIPLPLVLNTIVFQPRIFRRYIIVASIYRVDVDTLSEVVTHFSEIVELRSEFASTLLQRLKENGHSVDDLKTELRRYDRDGAGVLDAESLRRALYSLGFRLSYFRFNSLVRTLFKLKRGMVEYAQLLHLVALTQHGDIEQFPVATPVAVSADDGSAHANCHLLLRQAVYDEHDDDSDDAEDVENAHERLDVVVSDDVENAHERLDVVVSDVDASKEPAPLAPVAPVAPVASVAPGVPTARPALRRMQSGFVRTSSRALRSLYLMESMDDVDIGAAVDDDAASPQATNYTEL
ncbi:hypothetical protein P43SY_004137 [Pythium insidiosum]|uniref:EF-hand domain-containing protein n=1 Tax=Pythium insidiosum TaxID=114742 RepID=A0AAD5Q5B3_PYTIN|nr:hypothetical protein P43SY_004137 [Pythium insidiosum]